MKDWRAKSFDVEVKLHYYVEMKGYRIREITIQCGGARRKEATVEAWFYNSEKILLQSI